MYLDTLYNPVECQSHKSYVKVTEPDFPIIHHCKIGQKFVNTITHELLHLA